MLMNCRICPRECGAERTETKGGGICRMGTLPVVAKAMLHRWEEPCLTGKYGAGAVFFSGCALHCSFCQNSVLSRDGFGKTVTTEELYKIFQRLIEDGAACLDLVTPSHFTFAILEALEKEKWSVPIVWNSSGYEKPETLKMLDGKVQVYLPDLKYAFSDLAQRYSGAADYFTWAKSAILEMFYQTGAYRIKNGLLTSGVLIRHMVLPGELENTRRVIDWVSTTFQSGDVLFSLMSQYTPQKGSKGNLARRITGAEYRAAVEYMENCGLVNGYVQERAAANEIFTPEFDMAGVEDI